MSALKISAACILISNFSVPIFREKIVFLFDTSPQINNYYSLRFSETHLPYLLNRKNNIINLWYM